MKRTWTLKLSCRHIGENNKVEGLQVQRKGEDGQFLPLEIDIHSAGFMIFVYSVFTCQHLYMYVNAAERGLLLEASAGVFELVTGEDWMLSAIRVHFDGKLRSGTASAEDIAYIESRMNQCPVSRNLHPSEAHESTLNLTG